MSNLLDLDDGVVVVSGGAGALGTTICRVLWEHGARIAVIDVLPEEEARRRLPAEGADKRSIYLRADLRDEMQVDEALATVEEAFSTLPAVVCCHAGVASSAPVDEYPMSEVTRVLEVNVAAAYLLAKHAVRRWRQAATGGQLIFTSSWVQDVPWPGITPYAASKAAVRALARGFARECAPWGIRANVVAPGIVGAGMALRQWETEPDYRARASRAVPLGRLNSPESVAHAFLFLCSRMSQEMTGATLLIDGGASLYPMDS